MSRWLAVLAFVALAWMGIGSASAQEYADQGQAYAACSAHAVASGGTAYCIHLSTCRYSNFPCYSCSFAGTSTICAKSTFTYPRAGSCVSRPASGKSTVSFSAGFSGVIGACDRGCKVYPPEHFESGSGSFSLSYTLGSGGSRAYVVDGWKTTGDVCGASDPDMGQQPADGEDSCVQVEGLTQCVKSDGRHCAVASSGKEFCWEPGENGIKASGNDAVTKSQQGKDAKPPPLPPNNGGDWEQKAQSTVVESKGGSANTSNVTQWQSSYGSQGQGASGSGTSGEGKGGSGSGSSLGGSGNGGKDDGDDDGAGVPGEGAGDFYTGNGKTVAGVFGEFKARVGESPLISAIRDFFTVNAGGACPVFSVSATTYWEAMTYDGHCSGDFLAALRAIGWVLMAIAALAAAYWALS